MMLPNHQKPANKLSTFTLMCCLNCSTAALAAGYYTPSNIQSFATKNIANNTVFNDQTLTLEAAATKNTAANLPYGVGHVANTQFANTGYAGCGVSFPLMQQIYKNAAQGKNYANNYFALNVFSHLIGYDVNSPLWSSTSGEGQVSGYLNFMSGQVGYPYRQYLRSMPALYPAYLGMYDNGKSCGRWAQVVTSSNVCADASGSTVGGASKVCTTPPTQLYPSTSVYGYIFDSCEDNNGWCRDDDAHLDMNSAITSNNNYISWKFVPNPYYTDTSAPASLKDVWLAWYNGPVNAYWTYLEVANVPDGLGMLQLNIGSATSPTWVNSHYQAGGSNNMTWTDGTSNGQTWQLQPMGSINSSTPPTDPTYQIRLFDINGYPIKNGQIYQFDLVNTSKSGIQPLSGEILFYQGQPGAGSSVITAPTGNSTLQVNVLGLPSSVALSAINPVIIDSNGFSYNPTSCNASSCTFSKLPSDTQFTFYGVYENEPSNDLVVRKIQRLVVNQPSIQLSGSSSTVNLSASTWDFTTTYTAAVNVPVSFSVAKKSGLSVNANLQALFIPTNNSSVTAITQGCFLNNYYPKTGSTTPTTCYLYYTAHNNGSFNATIPPMTFTMQMLQYVGVNSANDMQLNGTVNTKINVSGYNPGNTAVVPQTVATVTYQPSTATQRSLYLILDPNSDAACLTGLNSVTINIGSSSTTLKPANINIPLLVNLTFTSGLAVNVSSTLNMQNSTSCQVNLSQASVTPGTDLVEMVKLNTTPIVATPVQSQGVNVTASANNPVCLNQSDTLSFSGSQVSYSVSTNSTQINLPAGSYTVTDQPFDVNGGTCELTPISTVVQANKYTNLALNYIYTPTQVTGLTCSAVAIFSSPATWGCNVTFNVTNTSNSSIPANTPFNLSWNGSSQYLQPYTGTMTSANGQVILQLPLYNPIAQGVTVNGSNMGWGMTVSSGATCSTLATTPIKCKVN